MLTINNPGRTVDFIIEEYTTRCVHAGRRGSPAIPAGTKVFVLRYENGGYFSYSYIKREDAERVIEVGKQERTNNEFYKYWNMVKTPEDTLHYGKVD